MGMWHNLNKYFLKKPLTITAANSKPNTAKKTFKQQQLFNRNTLRRQQQQHKCGQAIKQQHIIVIFQLPLSSFYSNSRNEETVASLREWLVINAENL